MTWLHTKEYALSSGLIHQAIFALQSEKTTNWVGQKRKKIYKFFYDVAKYAEIFSVDLNKIFKLNNFHDCSP